MTLRTLQVPAHGPLIDRPMQLWQTYAVAILDATDAPWNVVFEGSEASLRRMYHENWGGDDFPGCDPLETP